MMPQGVKAHTSLQFLLCYTLWGRANKLEELGDEGGDEPPPSFLDLAGANLRKWLTNTWGST